MSMREDGQAAVESPPDDFVLSPAREMSLHMLRMLETRMDAAGIAFQSESQLLLARMQLKLLAAAAIFFAIWGGIVLLAIALPDNLRVPVLSFVVVGFLVLGVFAYVLAGKKMSTQQIGSLRWFLDSLRQDLEVFSRALARPDSRGGPTVNPPAEEPDGPPADFAPDDFPPDDSPTTHRRAPSDLAA